jgi:DNA-binding response OmpR family regulator
MPKILFIEDDVHLTDTYNFLFTQEGYEVVWAQNGEEGLRKANEENPDVIVLDMMMPTMSGLDFLKLYDPKNKHPNVKVIAFSNMQTDVFMHEAIKLGAMKYEIKSTFSPRKLVALIMDLFGDQPTNT